jgi:hypothetical protein
MTHNSVARRPNTGPASDGHDVDNDDSAERMKHDIADEQASGGDGRTNPTE